MKLLFEENLSPVLPTALSDCYDECQHVRDIGLKASSDAVVWEYAAANELMIVTKDSGVNDATEFLADRGKAFLVLS